MNRLTAIGLASLVAYGLLIASKYTGVVSAARDDRAPQIASATSREAAGDNSGVEAIRPEPRQATIAALPAPVPRAQVSRVSGIALEFRNARDLKVFTDGLSARSSALTSDERYYLARALEECMFAASISEDLAAYSAKNKRQFVSGLPAGDPNNDKRIAAYEAVDNTQRCIGFQNAKVSQRDIEALFHAAAQQGDARAQARLITAELSKNIGKNNTPQPGNNQNASESGNAEFAMLIGLLESRDPEAMMYVGQFLAQNAVAQNLRVGANGEIPEPSAFLGAFSLVACDVGQDCTASQQRELLQACAYGGYCNAQSFEELYQNYLASPWAWQQAARYRDLIHTALQNRNWGLIGLTPKIAQKPSTQVPQ